MISFNILPYLKRHRELMQSAWRPRGFRFLPLQGTKANVKYHVPLDFFATLATTVQSNDINSVLT
jgi:hypothetical protein